MPRTPRSALLRTINVLVTVSIILGLCTPALQPPARAQTEPAVGPARYTLPAPAGPQGESLSRSSAAIEGAVPGIHAYAQDYVNCAAPQVPEVAPYAGTDGICGSHWQDLYICSEGATVHVTLLAEYRGAGAFATAYLHRVSGADGFTNIEAPRTLVYRGGLNCEHWRAYFEGDVYLPPGKYKMHVDGGAADAWCPPPQVCTEWMSLSMPEINDPARTFADECPFCNNPQAFVLRPVNTRSGNFTHQQTDLSIPTRGLPLTFERSYNALDTAAGPLGQGWTHSYAMHVISETRAVKLVAPHGSRLPFYRRGDGTFEPGPGVLGSLVQDAGDGSYQLTLSNQTVYTFDSEGKLTAERDEHGNTTTLSYTDGNPTSITAPDGRSLTLAYDLGKLVQVTDPLSRTVQYAYTGDLLTSVTDPGGQTWTFAYDAQGRMTAMTDPQGGSVTNEYDTEGRVVVQRDELNQPTSFTYNADNTVVTDANVDAVTHTYNELGALSAVTDALGHTTRYEYDSDFNRTAVTDPLGHTTHYTWSECGCQPTSIEDAQGHVTTMTYDERNNLLSRTDPLERTTRYAYDAQDNMVAMTNTLGIATTFGYDAYGQMTTSSDLNGHLTQYGYDGYGNLTVITDTLGGATTMAYDLAGRATAVTDAREHTTTTDYDALSRPITVTDALDGRTLFDYDALGHVTRITDANDKATRMEYDAAGRVITTTNALNDTTVRAYDPVGRLTSLTDANDKTTSYAYDAAGRLTTTTDALNGQTVYGYDAAGNVTSVRDPSGRTVTSQYDELNRLTSVTDALGNTTTYGYDAVGNRTSTRDPSGVLVSNTYDELDRLRTVTSPIATVATYEYDNAGNLLAVTDANNHTTTYTYDELDRLETVRDALEGLTSYEYDEVGNLVTATDARDHATQRVYDALNRLETVTNPLGQETAYGYDAVGNVTTMTDADQRVTTYDYDDLYRLTGVQYPDSSVGYTYDAVGNRLSMADATGTTSYTYDELYRPETITAPRTGTVGYAYDAAGRRTGIDYPSGEHAGYGYDAAGQLATVSDWAGKETGYSYDAAGRLLKAQLPNGVEMAYGYDAAGRLTHVQHSTWQETLTGLTYTLDAEGNRVGVHETTIRLQSYYFPALGRPEVEGAQALAMGTTSLPESEEAIAYTYDAADRLTGASYTSGDSYAYGYDAVGNRTALETVLGGVSDSTSYEYDDGDRIATVDGVTYAYDNRGNLTSDGTWTYTYDGAGRMVWAEKEGSVYTYAYNGDGLLVAETIDGVETVFTWDLALAIPQVLATSDGTKNLYGLERIGVEQGGAWRYPLPDALGSVRQWTDPAGAVLGVQSYGPFGEPRGPVGTPPWGFTGEWQDPAGMVYLRARWYNVALGRFNQVDPFAGDLMAPATQHAYTYASNNALRYTDPSGRFVNFLVQVVAGAAVGGAIGYGAQVVGNVLQRGLTAQAFTDINWDNVKTAAVSGAVGAATFGVGTALLGTGWAATLTVGAVSGALTGQASRLTVNALTHRPLTEGLGRVEDLLTDAAAGAAGAAVAKGLQSLWAPETGGEPEACRAGENGITLWPADWDGRQVIEGLEYTEHALGRMMPVGFGGRGVPPSVVENAVQYGQVLPGNRPGTIVHVYDTVKVVTDALSKVVVTVIKTGR